MTIKVSQTNILVRALKALRVSVVKVTLHGLLKHLKCSLIFKALFMNV